MDMQHEIFELTERREFFRRAFVTLWANSITGDYAEFGCCTAQTFRLAYQESRKVNYMPRLWAFDSFHGFPPARTDDHPTWRPGAMAMSQEHFVALLDHQRVPPGDYTIIPGFYEESLAATVSEHYCRDICLAYIDCDMYDSSTSVFQFIKPRLKHGMIIALDDYYCFWPGGIAGERVAFLEMARDIADDYNFLPYHQFGWHGQSFVVEARRYLKGIAVSGHL
jgi:O-methyltransferase